MRVSCEGGCIQQVRRCAMHEDLAHTRLGDERLLQNSLPRFANGIAAIVFMTLFVGSTSSNGVYQSKSNSRLSSVSDGNRVDSWAIEQQFAPPCYPNKLHLPTNGQKRAAEREEASNVPTQNEQCYRLRTTGTRRRTKVRLQQRNTRGLVLSTCTGNPSNLLYSSSPSASEIGESILKENTMLKFFSHKLPYDAVLQLNLEDSKWMKCTSSILSELSGHEKLEVLGLERNLIGNGAHRELSTLLTIRLEEISTCHMVTVEKLQAGVFADKFELDGLVARQVYTDAQVYGDHNLELPSLHSSQSIVVLHTIFSTGNTKSEGLELITQVKVSLPLHARYPPLSVESHVPVNFSLPYVLFHCSSDIVDIDDTKMDGKKRAWTVLSWSENFSLESRVLHWAVPAGNPLHTQFVAVMTAFTALIGVVALLVVSNYSFGVLK